MNRKQFLLIADDYEAVEAGQALFQTNCVACHGETGMGGGPAAETLEPKPASLADGEMMSTVSDADDKHIEDEHTDEHAEEEHEDDHSD
ncbi:MAG: hypothetical protein DWQ04_15040 [Chloroflexi bacterium]|nr:MAG: hypothetical protein DWQ04_15040 [Chloroflexota bacterium]